MIRWLLTHDAPHVVSSLSLTRSLTHSVLHVAYSTLHVIRRLSLTRLHTQVYSLYHEDLRFPISVFLTCSLSQSSPFLSSCDLLFVPGSPQRPDWTLPFAYQVGCVRKISALAPRFEPKSGQRSTSVTMVLHKFMSINTIGGINLSYPFP